MVRRIVREPRTKTMFDPRKPAKDTVPFYALVFRATRTRFTHNVVLRKAFAAIASSGNPFISGTSTHILFPLPQLRLYSGLFRH